MEYGNSAELEFGIRWESLEFGGALQPVRLLLEAATPGTAKTSEVNVKQPIVTDLGGQDDDAIGYLLFPYLKKNYQIPVGFQSRWVTLKE